MAPFTFYGLVRVPPTDHDDPVLTYRMFPHVRLYDNLIEVVLPPRGTAGPATAVPTLSDPA